jgi:hypothetical protein
VNAHIGGNQVTGLSSSVIAEGEGRAMRQWCRSGTLTSIYIDT